MYKLYYNYKIEKLADVARLCYFDTDSFIIHVKLNTFRKIWKTMQDFKYDIMKSKYLFLYNTSSKTFFSETWWDWCNLEGLCQRTNV